MTTKIDLYRGNEGLEASRALLYPIVYAMNPQDDGAATKGVVTGAVKAGIGLTSAVVGLAGKILGKNQEVDEESPQEMSIRVNNYSNCSLLATLYPHYHDFSSGPVNTQHQVIAPFESCTLSLYSDGKNLELPTDKPHRIRLEAEPYGLEMLNTETRWVDIEFVQLRQGAYQMGNSVFKPVSVRGKNFNDDEVEATGLALQEGYDVTEKCGSVAISVKTTDKPDGECQLVGFHSPNSISASKNNLGSDEAVWTSAPQCMTLDYCLVPTDIHEYNADGNTIGDPDSPEAPERRYPSWTNLSERPEETHTIVFVNNGSHTLHYGIDYVDHDDEDNLDLPPGEKIVFTVKKNGSNYEVYYQKQRVKYLDLNDGSKSDDLLMPGYGDYGEGGAIQYDAGNGDQYNILLDLFRGEGGTVHDTDGIDGDTTNEYLYAWYVLDDVALISVGDSSPENAPT
ncbi:hypothetical protein [Vibrio pectenicida]|uniref:Uncharacterized protein n=1 Tax=Vibrio pectenicida TaxID=62763 RepID=A0A3R9G053_9VIBR|nr:hypothetical protein [Vibrio pectenicida]RSD29167.1 hypothetical protein EJA03_18410 [Vibrio pectenicida]